MIDGMSRAADGRRCTTRFAVATAGGSALAAWAALQRPGRTYGSTGSEHRTSLPGDEICREPQFQTDHATTIDATPGEVWPWLVQMGWGRGQWYTSRSVDRLLLPANGPSADRIVPELQDLKVGDRVLDGPPEANCSFAVKLLEPERHLVLHSS